MTRIWFTGPLETVAAYWQVLRRDGVALGFTSHDRDLWIGGILHSATPGMVPSSIRMSADFEPDSAEVQGALSHDSISAHDLAKGLFDGAGVRIGVVDWETGEHEVLYRGTIGSVSEEEGRFTAELASRKTELALDPVPRTSPGCRAAFCGPGCNLPAVAHTHEASLLAVDEDANAIAINAPLPGSLYVAGQVRWLEGPHAGAIMTVMASGATGLVLDTPLEPGLSPGTRLLVREGCDHTLDSCATRFGNAVNFQGEPYLPGNDHLLRHPAPAP